MNNEGAQAFLLFAGLALLFAGAATILWAYFQQPSCSFEASGHFKNLEFPIGNRNGSIESGAIKLTAPCASFAQVIQTFQGR